MMTLAKALYDNTAECADELAFRKGDILTVMEQAVAGTSGWWMCSLYGRQGLAPANRLRLLSQATGGSTAALCPKQDKPAPTQSPNNSPQNIYQIPSVSRVGSGESERTEQLYKVPSTPLTVTRAPGLSGPQHLSGEQVGKAFNMASSPRGELYDVPSQGRRASLFPVSTTPRASFRKHSLVPMCELQKRFESPAEFLCNRSKESCIYDIPPSLVPDNNYDFPIPSTTEIQKTTISSYNTLPIIRKPEWIYDVPVSPDKQSPPQFFPDKSSPKPTSQQELYDTIPARGKPVHRSPKSPLLKTIPKSISVDSPPILPPRIPLLPRKDSIEQESVYDLPSDDHIPLECRVEPPEATTVSLYRWKACPSLRKSSGSQALISLEENVQNQSVDMTSSQNQRISTASSSSSSSCDSLALSSSSPEPLREVLLPQNEVSRRLMDLQDGVCKAVPKIMEFVSSGWRSKSHMEQHLEEIKEAARGVAVSLSSFLNFAMDIKGNARRLTDCNLQARLRKQLCTVEDSGVILQQTVGALDAAGWTLELLSQEVQAQSPDQLERFVMVARTVPEDVKRLVSMVNANGKLLFKPLLKEPENVDSAATNPHKRSEVIKEEVGIVEDDYVELQTKTDFENQQKEALKDHKENATESSQKVLREKKPSLSESPGGTEEQRPASLKEHCRLYFGALQKALGGFVDSLREGQPPEKFISQSKLVIMVGQRLVDTLYKEAQRGESRQSLLCKSSHLCALLKQLAVATKKAALHFPDRQAVLEALEFAKELSQRAQHFRLSLDL